MSDVHANVEAAIDATLGGNASQNDDNAQPGGDNASQQDQQQSRPTDGQANNNAGAANNSNTAGADNRTGSGGDGARQPAGTKPQRPAQAQSGNNNTRNPGDLVDAQGNVLARAGAERRHYENWQRTTTELRSAQQQLQTLTTERDAYRNAAQMPQQLGLKPDQTVTALQLFANYLKNPVETIKYILTEAKAAGHNVDNIGAGGTLDVAALSRVIDQRLAPLTDAHTAEQHARQAAQEAEQVWGGFVERFPDAPLHETAMVSLMQRDQSLDLSSAYFMLKSWALENGLDFSKPLAEQYAAKTQQNGGNNSDTRTAQQPRGGLPNGRGGNAAPLVNMQPGAAASENMSSGDIVKEAMREAGINLQ